MAHDLFELICKVILFALAVVIGLTILSFLWGLGLPGIIASVILGYLIWKQVERKRDDKTK